MAAKTWAVLALLLSNAALSLAVPGPKPPKAPKPLKRKEWRTLSKKQKSDYLSAVQCILTKPSITPPFPNTGVLSRYDDLIYTHIQQTMSIHFTGHFLPWHRYYTAVYETMLRTECGYTGAQPYWDWTLDATSESAFLASPVFNSVTGFGGNGPFVETDPSNPFNVPGRSGGGCVTGGPFAGVNDIVHLGPSDAVEYNPQCLKRDLSPYFGARYLGMNQTQVTLAQGDFGWFARTVEGMPSFETSGVHGGGHYGVGGTLGQMGDLYTSPADPLFYLHHANLDRLWWSWQKLNLSERLTDISGPIHLMDYGNTAGGNTTLDFPLSVGVSAADTSVGDVMKINACGAGGVLCYEYDKVYTLS